MMRQTFCPGNFQTAATGCSIKQFLKLTQCLPISDIIHTSSLRRTQLEHTLSWLDFSLFISRPPETKHQTFWDVDVVLLCLSNLGANQCRSLSDLTLKLAMLLVLISADRSSDLVKLFLNHSQVSPDRVVLTLTKIRKQDRQGYKSPNLVIPALEEDSSLCCILAIKAASDSLAGVAMRLSASHPWPRFMVVLASAPVGATEILGICFIAVADSIEPYTTQKWRFTKVKAVSHSPFLLPFLPSPLSMLVL